MVDAHAERTLVFVVGAGASMGAPSNLPSFESLTKQLAERAGLRLPSDTKQEEFPTWLTLVPRGDAGLDRLDRGRGVLLARDRGRDLLVADGHDALAVDA